MNLKLITVFFLLFSTTFFGQIKFEAVVSKNKLGLNENLRVDFKMNDDGDNFTPPNFNGFNIVGGPNQSVSNSWINGARTFSKTYTYFLSPKERGRFIIGQASIEIDGDIYKTSTVEIQVTEAVDSSASPQSNDKLIKDDVELVVEVSKNNPYLNEPILIVYKLFFSPEINIRNLGEIDSPNFKNFWSQKIDIPRLEIKRSSFKGKSFNYVEWKKTLLYPQKVGAIEINPMTLDVSIDTPTNRRDFFGNVIYNQTSNKVSSKNKVINVKPLPDQGRPKDFSGAVGNFNISLNSNKNELKATESFQLDLKVSGTGNLKLFSLPDLTVPSSLEKYDPEYKENVKVSASGMNGSILNSYTIVPQFQGKYPIPQIKFTYFNPSAKKYMTIFTKEKIIDVFEGPKLSNSDTSTNIQRTIPKNSLQFNFIDLSSEFFEIDKKVFQLDNIIFYILLFPFLIIILSFTYIRFSSKMNSEGKIDNEKSKRMAYNFLKDAKKDIDNTDLFYISLEKALFNFLKSRFNFQTFEFSKENVKTKLTELGVDSHNIDMLIDLLKSCEYSRYTPITPKDMSMDYDKAVRIISNLEKL
tara:strand:+ start:2518 stop:4263 length:1746 start_codon:yes stop_codon:yes gene_type:complete